MPAPKEFHVRLQHGIAGGFAPPTPTAVHTITASNDMPKTFLVQSHLPQGGGRNLAPAPAKELSREEKEHAELVDELHSILKDLPKNEPGTQDIYGLDKGIAWGSEDLEWVNFAPQGCGGAESTVQPTEEQKAKFKRAVEIVEKIATA